MRPFTSYTALGFIVLVLAVAGNAAMHSTNNEVGTRFVPGYNDAGCSEPNNTVSDYFIEDVTDPVGPVELYGWTTSAVFGRLSFHLSHETGDTKINIQRLNGTTNSMEPYAAQAFLGLPTGTACRYIAMSDEGYGMCTGPTVTGEDIKFLYFNTTSGLLTADGELSVSGASFTRCYAIGRRGVVHDSANGIFYVYDRNATDWESVATITSDNNAAAFSWTKPEMAFVLNSGDIGFYLIRDVPSEDVKLLYSTTPVGYSGADVTDLTFDYTDDLIVGVSSDDAVYRHRRASGFFYGTPTQAFPASAVSVGYRLAANTPPATSGFVYATAPDEGAVVLYRSPSDGSDYVFTVEDSSSINATGAINNAVGNGGDGQIVFVNDGFSNNHTKTYCAEGMTCLGGCGYECDTDDDPCSYEIYDEVGGTCDTQAFGPDALGAPICRTTTCIANIGYLLEPIEGGGCAFTVNNEECFGTCADGKCDVPIDCGIATPPPAPSPSATPSISTTSSATPTISASSTNSASASTTPSLTSTRSVTQTPTISSTASTSTVGLCAGVTSCDDGDSCTDDYCDNTQGGCVHDAVTPGTACPFTDVAIVDPCFPSAVTGYCPGAGAPCTQDKRSVQETACPTPAYTCQAATLCDSATGCGVADLDERCPQAPPDAYPCSAYVCDPARATGTTHGCLLTALKATGDACQSWDACRIETTCQSDLLCGGGRYIECDSGAVCVDGTCVLAFSLGDSSSSDGGDDDDNGWSTPVIWMYVLWGLSILIGCCCCGIIVGIVAWFLSRVIEDDDNNGNGNTYTDANTQDAFDSEGIELF